MKFANKVHADFVAVIGVNELNSGTVNLKYMPTGEQQVITLQQLEDEFDSIAIQKSVANLTDSMDAEDLKGVDLSGIIRGNMGGNH